MTDRILIAAAQLNCTVGDVAGNAARILESAARGVAAGADLVLTPEFSLCGYPPEDLVLREGFLRDCRRELDRLAPRVRGTSLVVGFPELADDGKRYNAAALIRDGHIQAVARKRELPNYDVFDEKRYFDAAHEPCVFELKGVRFGLAICEDIWFSRVPEAARAAGAQVMLSINASPYHKRKQATRHSIFRDWIRATGMPMVAANLVGGQDELDPGPELLRRRDHRLCRHHIRHRDHEHPRTRHVRLDQHGGILRIARDGVDPVVTQPVHDLAVRLGHDDRYAVRAHRVADPPAHAAVADDQDVTRERRGRHRVRQLRQPVIRALHPPRES
jgi:predicted amidohydrolase